jgi:hypothetical protein
MAADFIVLKNRDDFQRLVDDGVEESLLLDYKASPALTRDSKPSDEMCKDVSAFANSAGGQLIYGIEERGKKGIPSGVDDGIMDPKTTREWIIQVLNSRVHPKMIGVTVERVPLSAAGFGFVINVPQTNAGPHQSPDKKYYRRHELLSEPMEDYEVRDVMNRATTPEPFLEITLPDTYAQITWPEGDAYTQSQPIKLTTRIGNRSSTPALYTHVNIYLSPDLVITASGSDSVDDLKTSDGSPVKSLSFALVVPAHFPLFKEKVFRLGSGTSIAIPSEHERPDKFYRIGYEITTPGYATRVYGYLIKRGNSLELSWTPWTADR